MGWPETHHFDGQGAGGKEPEGGSQDGETHCDGLEYSVREEEDGYQDRRGNGSYLSLSPGCSTEHSMPGHWL